MRKLAPEGDVYQAGTLSGNPVAMAAGLKTLEILEREDGWDKLRALGQRLEHTLTPVLADAPIPARLARIGSIFWIALFADELPRRAEAIDARAPATYAKAFHVLLEHGIALAPSAFEVSFLSLAHTNADIDRLAAGLFAALCAAAEN